MTSRLSSRPAALLTAAVCLLSAAPLWAADEYYALAGLKAAGFQKFLDNAKSQGYEISYINGCQVGDHIEYCGVGVKHFSGKVESEARYDLTDKEVRDYADEMKDKGFRPTELSTYHTKEGPLFASSWVKDKAAANAKWEFKFGQTQKEFEKTFANERDAGPYPYAYRMTAYQGNDGGARFSTMFAPMPKDSTQGYKVNATADQLDKQLERWHSDGFLLLRIHAYDTPDGLRFLALARKNERDSKIEWEGRVGMTGERYQKAFDELAGKKYEPICICEYMDGGEPHFAAVWLKRN